MALLFQDIKDAADRLDIEPCAVQAVVDVESSGNGFGSGGCILIQFEGHLFWKHLRKFGVAPEPLRPGNEDILYPSFTTRYVLGQIKEWDQFTRASAIHAEAAMLSTSWGMFQILGQNHKACGFDTVQEFVEAQQRGEKEQLAAFCAFVRSEGMLHYLRLKDWAGFARRYNGPAYAANRYDKKMSAAYSRCITKQ